MLRSQPMRRFLSTFFRQWRLYMLNSSSTSLPISPSTRYVNMPRTLIVPSRTHMSHACESPANRLKTSRASKSNAATGSAAHQPMPRLFLPVRRLAEVPRPLRVQSRDVLPPFPYRSQTPQQDLDFPVGAETRPTPGDTSDMTATETVPAYLPRVL